MTYKTPLPDLEALRSAAAGLDTFMDENLPLARAAGLRLSRVDARGLALAAPLDRNDNHHGSAFGGSLYVAGLAAGWGLVHLLQQLSGLEAASLMVREAQIKYLRPVLSDFEAVAGLPDESDFDAFAASIMNGGGGALSIRSEIRQGEKVACELHCEFAARMFNR